MQLYRHFDVQCYAESVQCGRGCAQHGKRQERLWVPGRECFRAFADVLVYGVTKKTINKRTDRDTNSRDEATGEVMRNIVLIVMPIILSSFIYNVNGFINSYMYSSIRDYGDEEDSVTVCVRRMAII